MTKMLLIIATHPIQYYAPVFKAVAAMGIPVKVIYGSDFSVAGYRDKEFGVSFSWDQDLLYGYESRFLSRVSEGGPKESGLITGAGLKNAVLAESPAAILLLGYGSRFERAAIRAAFSSRRPLLFRGDVNDVAHSKRSIIKHVARRFLLSLFYRRCSKVLCVGSLARDHYKTHKVPDDKIEWSPHCVDLAPFRTTESDRTEFRVQFRRELGLTDEHTLLLFSGKIMAHKGVDLLLHAHRALPETVRSRLTIGFLGDGDLKSKISADAKGEQPVPVRFFGFQNQSQLSKYYLAADLLVLPSFGETWGLVVNDALHHGLPVIVSDMVGCVSDLVFPGRTGEIFSSGDVNSLAAAILRGITLTDRLDIREACRDIVDQFSVAAAAHGIARAFHAVSSDFKP